MPILGFGVSQLNCSWHVLVEVIFHEVIAVSCRRVLWELICELRRDAFQNYWENAAMCLYMWEDKDWEHER